MLYHLNSSTIQSMQVNEALRQKLEEQLGHPVTLSPMQSPGKLSTGGQLENQVIALV